MANIKKLDFYNAITGDSVNEKNYGRQAEVFKKADNIGMIFSSRGEYLGVQICNGKFINGKFTGKKGPKYFKSSDDFKIWAGMECINLDNSGGKILMTLEEDKFTS